MKNLDLKTAKYFRSGRKHIISVKPNKDFTLTLTFDNGEIRLYDCKPFLQEGTIFKPLKQYNNFKRAYLDEFNSVSWDIDPNIDSNIVWNNKIDISPDTCYMDSILIKKSQ